MLRRSLVASIMLVELVACGGSSSQPQGPTAASVSAQPSDVPNGLARCDLTGDINSFIAKEAKPNPSTSQSAKSSWDDARKKGATAAYISLYADSSAHCASFESSQNVIGSATYKLIVNFVIQFKDEKGAADAYVGNQKILNFSPADIRNSGIATAEGTKTGLTANSIVLDQSLASQHYYLAVWQNKAFLVILAILNVDSTASQKVALAENSRIK